MRKLLCSALCLSMALLPTAKVVAADGRADLRDTPYADMTYVPYDPDDGFYDGTATLSSLAVGNDEEAVLELYENLYDEFVLAETASVLAQLHHSDNVTDAYWTDEMLASQSVVNDMSDALCIAMCDVLTGPCGESFAAYIGDDAVNALADYEPMTDREAELLAREAEITAQYDELYAASDGLTYTYDGEEWTMSMLSSEEGDALYESDWDGYSEVYSGLQKVFNDEVGPLFTELVAIRSELADIWGYESYASGLYVDGFGRDFTPDDAQKFCDDVKRLAAFYNEELYYSDMWSMAGDVQPVFDAQELVALLGDYVGRVDASLEEPWQYMVENGLYNLPSWDDTTAEDGGYTTTIPLYQSPYIYNALSGSCYDLDGLSHEFGHYVDAYYNELPNELLSTGSFDLFEVHSTGLEALLTEFYDEIYTDGADIARFIVLGGLIESVIDGCLQDEFQRRVYEQPDMTLDEINELYTELSAEYGRYTDGIDYGWQYIPHTFTSPFYYISYAVSALAAMQIWDMAQLDWDGAVDTYLAIVHSGAYEDGYMSVLSTCGLRLFTEDGAAADICRPILERLSDLEDAVMRGTYSARLTA